MFLKTIDERVPEIFKKVNVLTMEGEEAVVDGAAVMGESNNDAHERAANRAPPCHPRAGGDPGGDLAHY
jgi:hypothetical protein